MQVKNEKTIERIAAILNEKLSEDGRSPSLQYIADKAGVSVATVSRYVSVLIERGTVVRKGKFCALSTPETDKAHVSVATLPIVGTVACGNPIFAEQNIEAYASISENLLGSGEFFCLRAHGDSMINAGIEDGDLVVIRRTDAAQEGQIVVALIDDEATLKRYYVDRTNHRIRLHPENDEMADMYFDNVNVQGVAVKVLKDLK